MSQSNAKSWLKSRTIIFNTLTALVTLGTDLAGVLPDHWSAKILAVVAFGNIVLRFVTTLPVE